MNPGYQRTDGVYNLQVPLFGLLKVLGGRPVGRENYARAGRYLFHRLDSDGAFSLQVFNNVGIVDYLVLDVDGRPEPFQALFNDLNSADYAGAKASRGTEYYLHDHPSFISFRVPGRTDKQELTSFLVASPKFLFQLTYAGLSLL